MPTKPEGVYCDGRGGWYFKANLGKDPLTGKRAQVTKRGFRTAAAAGRARRELLDRADKYMVTAGSSSLTMNGLLDLYLDGLDADARLAAKTRFDYRKNTDSYVRPVLGPRKVSEVTPTVILAWQRALAKGGGVKAGRALAPNTIRLARAPLAGAFKLAVTTGIVAVNPMLAAPRPAAKRSIARYWTPEQARQFLGMMEGDRTYPVWAVLLGAGLRIGELVWLRWDNISLTDRHVRIVEFASTLGYELVPSAGKSRDAVRTVDLDDGLVAVLRLQRKLQSAEQVQAVGYLATEYVFSKPTGGAYHPQTLSKMLARLACEMGLPRLTAHGLRHTSATLMLANGVPPKVAAERLGHADATLFTNLYSHVVPTMQREAADRIGAALFAPPSVPA